MCTNRDLALHMPRGVGRTTFRWTSRRRAEHPCGCRPIARVPRWPMGHCVACAQPPSLNYLSLVDSTSQEGATTLRDLLELYASGSDASARKQIDGVRSVQVGRVVRRLLAPGPLAFARARDHGGRRRARIRRRERLLLGSVLDRFFARYVSINSFTENGAAIPGRGEINRWVAAMGRETDTIRAGAMKPNAIKATL